jgi:hypothetical protein
MYSLHVGLSDGVVPAGRLLEYTDTAIRESFGSDFNALQDLPVLTMPEVGDDRFEPVAYIGTAIAVKRDGREHRFGLFETQGSHLFHSRLSKSWREIWALIALNFVAPIGLSRTLISLRYF